MAGLAFSAKQDLEVAQGERWDLIAELVGSSESVLDVGCRDRGLAKHLPAATRYVGMDLFEPADVVASAEDPLPFDDDSFDTVVYADVLEHLNDPHSALDEGLRVARGAVIVLLPNCYTLLHRLRYAVAQPLAKYEFGPDNRLDRHRWLMTFDEGRKFTRGRAGRAGWSAAREYAYVYPFNRTSVRTVYRVARAAAGVNLWSWEYAARLEPSAAA